MESLKKTEEKQSGMKCFPPHDAEEECDALLHPLSITVCVTKNSKCLGLPCYCVCACVCVCACTHVTKIE